MKKLFLLLVMTFGIVATAFADDYAYVSNVKQWGSSVVVTVSAKSGVFNEYPYGIMVSVRPDNTIADVILGDYSYNTKTVTLTPDEPSKEVRFDCDEGRMGKRACNNNSFVVKLKNK